MHKKYNFESKRVSSVIKEKDWCTKLVLNLIQNNSISNFFWSAPRFFSPLRKWRSCQIYLWWFGNETLKFHTNKLSNHCKRTHFLKVKIRENPEVIFFLELNYSGKNGKLSADFVHHCFSLYIAETRFGTKLASGSNSSTRLYR